MALSLFLITKAFFLVFSLALWFKFDIGSNEKNNDVGNSIESKPTNPTSNWLLSSDPGASNFQIPPAKEGQFTVLGGVLNDIKDNAISHLNSPLFNKEKDPENAEKPNVFQDLGSLVNSAFGHKLTSNNAAKPAPAPVKHTGQKENVKEPTVSGDNSDEQGSKLPISRPPLPNADIGKLITAAENLIKNKPASPSPAINIPGLESLFKAPSASVPESDTKVPSIAPSSKSLFELPNFGALMRRGIPQI